MAAGSQGEAPAYPSDLAGSAPGRGAAYMVTPGRFERATFAVGGLPLRPKISDLQV